MFKVIHITIDILLLFTPPSKNKHVILSVFCHVCIKMKHLFMFFFVCCNTNNAILVFVQLEQVFNKKRAEVKERQQRELEELQNQAQTTTTNSQTAADDSKMDKVCHSLILD